MDNTISMTPEETAELHSLLGLDSANMPSSMAVNQSTKVSADALNTSNAPRSKYYGVYTNKGNNSDEFPFRAAVRLGKKSDQRYANLGYFKCEHVSAIAYNVAAINYFGKGAWINPVDIAKCDPAEHERYRNLRMDYIQKSIKALKEMHANGQHPRKVDLERNAAEEAASI